MTSAAQSLGFAGLATLASDIGEFAEANAAPADDTTAQAESSEGKSYAGLLTTLGVSAVIATMLYWYLLAPSPGDQPMRDATTSASPRDQVTRSATPGLEPAGVLAATAAQEELAARREEAERITRLESLQAQAKREEEKARRAAEMAALAQAKAAEAKVLRDARRAPAKIVSQIQAMLAQAGYNPGPADGVAGTRTVAAIRAYERDRARVATGLPSSELLAFMKAQQRVPSFALSKFDSQPRTDEAPVKRQSQTTQQPPSLADALRAQIRFDASGITGNPKATFHIRMFSNGSIRSVKIVKPSDSKAWNRAAARAIARVKRLACGSPVQCNDGLTVTLGPKDR